MKLSVIIPCFNEAEGIIYTHEELVKHLQDCQQQNLITNYEIIFVDDGSKDATAKKLHQIAESDSFAKYIIFSRNFGKESAMLAGLDASTGDATVIMDADLQHPPYLLLQLLQEYHAGYDQVIACRNRQGDAFGKTLFSKLYYKIINKLTDVEMEDGAGDFRILSRRVVDAITSLPERNRFLKGLFSWVGFTNKNVYYDNVSREFGESKFSFKSLINYGVQGILSFNDKPLRISIQLGLFSIVLSLLYIIYMLIEFSIRGISSPGYFSTMTAILFIGGIQLISIGVLGEYIGKIYYEVKKRPNYIVKESNFEIHKSIDEI